MMTIEEKQNLFNREYSLTGWGISEAYKILCLVGALFLIIRKKDEKATVFGLLDKIIPEHDKSLRVFEAMQYHIMGHLDQGTSSFPTFGLKDPKSLANGIRDLMREHLPF